MANDRTVVLDKVGIITHAEFKLPPVGGILILKGRNGTGKSTILEAMRQGINGKGKLNVQDGAEKAEVSFLGVTIRAGKQTRHSGCLEVESLEGKFSIADIIDPGFADPVANDKRAALGILQVAGAKADPELFYDLVGGETQFRKFVTKDTLKEPDLVSMASKVKRDLEASARDKEADATEWSGKVEGLESSLTGVAHEKELPSVEQIEADLKRAREISLDAHASQRNSLTAIAAFEAKMTEFRETTPTVDVNQIVREAKSYYEESASEERARRVRVMEITDMLKDAETALAVAVEKTLATELARDKAEQHAEQYQALKTFIESGRPIEFPEADVVAADERIAELQDLLQVVKNSESADKTRKEIASLKDQIKGAASTANALRSAAQSVDGVLTEMIAKVSGVLRYENERLVMDTERGPTYFHDPSGTNGLSKGQRTKVVIDIAASAVGEGGIIVDDGDFCQDLDPIALMEVAEHARSRRVTIATAMCTADEELMTEVI